MQPDQANVGDLERLWSVGIGALLAARGLEREGLKRALLLASGVALLYRGAVGDSAVYRLLGLSTGALAAPALPAVLSQGLAFALPPSELVAKVRSHMGLLLGSDHAVTLSASVEDDAGAVSFHWSCRGCSGELKIEPLPVPHEALLTLRVVAGAEALWPQLLTRHDIGEALRRFRMWAEAGEVAVTAGQPHGKRSAAGELLLGLSAELRQRSGEFWPLVQKMLLAEAAADQTNPSRRTGAQLFQEAGL